MTLPDGFRVGLAHGILTADHGRLLVGGSPLTAMRLTSRAQAMLAEGGVTVTDAASAHLADRLLATNLGVPELGQLPAVAEHDLTVVIPVRDRPDQLDRTLAALRPLRCVVVDDASLFPQPIAEVAHRSGADLLHLPVNVGPAAARNAGLATVSTPYVAFVDSDVEVAAADLTRLARHFADPAVSLVGPRVSGVARSARPAWFEKYDAVASSLTLGTSPGTVRPGAAVAWLPSACLVARTEALGHGFDPQLRVGEDVDLVWRMVDAGHRVRYDPTIEAHHDARSTMRGWLGRKFVYGSGGAALAARHGNNLAPAVLTPTYAVAAWALLLRRRWAIPVAAAALASGARSVRAPLADTPGRDAIAARLAVRGLVWAVRQESALLLRHWWPAAAVAAVRSHKMRRALVSALLIDAMVALYDTPPDSRLGLATLAAGRRLDDLSYGAGLWYGALRAHSPRVLWPRRPTSPDNGDRLTYSCG
jgi:mycofactocin system glycosyltransferase